MTTSWQAVTPLLTIQEAEETEMISLIASPAPPASAPSPSGLQQPRTPAGLAPLSPLSRLNTLKNIPRVPPGPLYWCPPSPFPPLLPSYLTPSLTFSPLPSPPPPHNQHSHSPVPSWSRPPLGQGLSPQPRTWRTSWTLTLMICSGLVTGGKTILSPMDTRQRSDDNPKRNLVREIKNQRRRRSKRKWQIFLCKYVDYNALKIQFSCNHSR